MNSLSVSPPPPPPPFPQDVPLVAEPESDPSPVEKKQKVNEDDEVLPREEVICDDNDSDEGYCPDWPEQKVMDHAVWEKYYQQIKESEGFDIVDYPGGCPMITIFPMPHYLNNPENYDKLKGYCERALEEYNGKQGTKWVVKNVLKVNGGGCRNFHFYLTFKVMTHEGDEDVFQTKAVLYIEGNVEFPIIRPKPKKDLGI